MQDMYNCLTEDQRKALLEKEQLMKQLKEREESFSIEKEILTNRQKDLVNGIRIFSFHHIIMYYSLFH